jgi:hypothetical protein
MQLCDDRPGHMNSRECVKEKCSEKIIILCRVFSILFQGREKMISEGAFLCSDRSMEPQPCDYKIVKA